MRRGFKGHDRPDCLYTVIVRNKLILYDKSSVLSIFFHWWNEVKMNIHLLRGGHKQAGTETSIIYKDGPNEHTFT
jgi:hypothetical protein